VEITIQFHDCLPVVFNSMQATIIARRAAQQVIGAGFVISQGRPSLGGEDFAFYQQVVDGCLVRFGADSLAGDGPAHSGSFDFDENVLPIGAAWLACVAMEWLDENGEQKGNS
jgi:hippurate hydrolase